MLATKPVPKDSSEALAVTPAIRVMALAMGVLFLPLTASTAQQETSDRLVPTPAVHVLQVTTETPLPSTAPFVPLGVRSVLLPRPALSARQWRVSTTISMVQSAYLFALQVSLEQQMEATSRFVVAAHHLVQHVAVQLLPV